jgi:predicted dehydrogenase
VGFNHRFHPGLARVAEEVHSGRHGEFMHLRARYGHGGRRGYDRVARRPGASRAASWSTRVCICST